MNVSLPNDLARLQTRFEHWRKTRTARSRIPEDLLQAASALLDRYSASAICRACRLHPTSLSKRAKPKRHSAALTKPMRPATDDRQTAFFPLPPSICWPASTPPSRPAAPDCRLALERADGTRLTLVLPALDGATLVALCSNFLRP